MTGARARSPDAKRARRHFILTTAEQILRSDGFDAFTMSSLANTTGLAKGTLYLYFSSREELVLALYIHLNDDWVDRFLRAEKAKLPPDYAALCARFYQSFAADALLVDLAGRTASGLEPYVATPVKVKAKRAYARAARRISGMFYQNFDCDPAQAQRLAWAFLAALSGAQQRAIEMQDNSVLPEDLQKLEQIMSCKDVFLNMVLPLAPGHREDPFGKKKS